jgi:signal transduction protein with GAF and PtsI domain
MTSAAEGEILFRAMPPIDSEELPAPPDAVERAKREASEKRALTSELQQARVQLYSVLEGARAAFSAENAVVRVLAGAQSIEEVAWSILDALCESFEFEVATFWMADDDGRLVAIAHRQSEACRAQRLEIAVDSLRLAPGEGLAGRVFVERRELLSEEAEVIQAEPVAAILAEEGLRTVCVFPIVDGGPPLGVIEMERRSRFEPDHAIDSAVRVIGDRIAAFIECSELRQRYSSLVALLEERLEQRPEPRAPGAEVVPLIRAA